jgi:hypothetical protein
VEAALRSLLLGDVLEAVGQPVDGAHFLVGGASPVATRQIRDAARRAAIVAAAPSAA